MKIRANTLICTLHAQPPSAAARFSAPSSPLHCGKRKASDAWAIDHLAGSSVGGNSSQQATQAVHFSVGSYPGPSSMCDPDQQQQQQQQQSSARARSISRQVRRCGVYVYMCARGCVPAHTCARVLACLFMLRLVH